MKIKITQQPSDGEFIVGQTYDVLSVHSGFVYVVDEKMNAEAVYFYEMERVE
jgi:hypothetical protein